jgi:arylsulfatase A-like enzyme
MASRPNILVILTEDLSPHSKTYGDPLSPLKSVDRIAQNALVFENAFCAAPVCAPSRFSMITGIEPASCSPAQNHAADGVLPPDIKLLNHPLKELGYYCANFSKADYNFKVDMASIWDDHSLDAHWRNREPGQSFFAFFNLMQTHESSIFRDEVTSVSPEEIELPPYLPDTPEIRADFARYYTAMEKSEAQISKLLDELEADGLADSTVILQISDHGGSTPRTKRFIYDSGNKVPLIIKQPGSTKQLRISTAVSLIDFAPTILDIAGAEKPTSMIGNSLLRLAARDDERMIFTGRDRMDENYDLIRTARTANYLYIRNYFPNRPWLQHQAFAWQAKGYQSWETEFIAGRTNDIQSRYFGEKPAEEFYDNRADPHQINNLIDVPELQELIQSYRDGLNVRTLAIFDNGFIPEGCSAAGLVNSRNPELYPLQEVLALANKSITKDVSNLQEFTEALNHSNEVIRFWAAQGLLCLGKKSEPVLVEVLKGLNDSNAHVRILLAELAAMLGHRVEALETFGALLSADNNFEVLIRVAKSMVALEVLPMELLDQCTLVWEQLRDPSKDTSGYFNAYSAFTYLISKMQGAYSPSSKIFDNELFIERMQRNNPGLIANMQHGRK